MTDKLLTDDLRAELSAVERFIIKYSAAVKVGLSREQLANNIGMGVDSVRRKRLKVIDSTGLKLPELPLTGINYLSDGIKDEFDAMVTTIASSRSPARIDDYTPNRRYVITSAQNATPVDEDFLNAVLNYCEINDAELLVIPLRYKNPTSIWSASQETAVWWWSSIRPYIQNYSRRLGKSLEYMGHIKTRPTAINPLSGFEDITHLSSGIFGHTKVSLVSVATPSQSLPKILLTTGCITTPNYTDSKAGHKGAFHHSMSAVVVEVDNYGHHHVRHIHWKDGGFYDLDSHYTPDGHTTGNRLLGLVTGDSHVEFIDPNVEAATYVGEKSMCGKLRPKHLVWHDVEDFYRRNHHHRGNDVIAYGKHHFGRNNVEAGLQITADFIEKYSNPDCVNVIVKSNHDEAFDRWLREADPKSDPENCKFYYYMKYHQMESVKMTLTGFSSFNPFAWWCSNPDEQGGLSADTNTIFLKRDGSNEIGFIETGFHGDVGTNGTRASIISFSKIGPKVIIGHSHSPGIKGGAYQVGLSAMLDLEYRSGPSSWMHTHCFIYPDGSRTLVHIIDGKYTTMYD